MKPNFFYLEYFSSYSTKFQFSPNFFNPIHQFGVEFNVDNEYEIQKILSRILFELFYFDKFSPYTST